MMGLNPAYSDARFRGEPPPGGLWPDRFAVVTACDPDGEPAGAASNLEQDAQLAAILQRAGHAFWRVTGGSADFSHAEPGYAVQTSLETALSFARDFRQQALFWVERGELFLVDCADGTKHPIGPWLGRLDDGTPFPTLP